MSWIHFFIPLYVVTFIGSFLVKTLVQYKRSGINPYRINKTSSKQQRFLQRYSNLLSLVWLLGGIASMALFYPSAITIMLWFLSFYGIYRQVLYEEDFLIKQHGQKYKHYQTHTGRFFPYFFKYKSPIAMLQRKS